MSKQEAYVILKNIYCNYNKINKCYYVYSYTPAYDPISKKTKKQNVVSIGKITEENGFGPIQFNSKFLNQHQIFASLKVIREDKNKIVIQEATRDPSRLNTRDDLLTSRHMKIGASYFIKSVVEQSYTGRAVNKLRQKKLISATTYKQLYTMLIYIIMEGFDHINAIEYFVRDHVVPHTNGFNKDTIYRLFSALSSEVIIEFYKIKQQIMQNDLSKIRSNFRERHFIALDGTNIDSVSKISYADYGKSKSGKDNPIVNFLALIDQTSGNLLGHCVYSGHTTDISTLEGSVKQLAYYGCKNYTLIVDRGYWSLYNLSVLYNLGVDFITHVKMSHTSIKNIVNKYIDDLSVGNGCIKISHGKEVNYACLVDLSWSYYNVNTKKKDRKPIYLYLFYNAAITASAKQALEDEVRELNVLWDEYKEALAKARKQKKKNPEPPVLTIRQQELIEKGIVVFNTKFNRYDLSREKANEETLPMGVWALAASTKMDCEEIFLRYRQRNTIEVMYRFFKNNVDGYVLNVSTEQSFQAKLFVGLLASEFLNSLKLKALKYNKKVADKEKVVFKQNSLHLTLKDLDTLECIYINENTIIPTTNMLKRHENLFKMMQINPIELQNTKLKNSVIEEGYGLVIDEEKE